MTVVGTRAGDRRRCGSAVVAAGIAFVGLVTLVGGAAGAATAASGPYVPGSAQAKTTLIVWDQEVRGGQNLVMTELNREFQRRNGNVKIRRVAKSFTDLQTTVKLAVSGPNPPDVVQANRGRDVMGLMVKGGLLLPLNKYSRRYKWSKRFSSGLTQLNSYSANGAAWGSGNLYGVSQVGQLVGAYYNKAKLKQLGLKVPRTFGEFERMLGVAKARGETPIAFGNIDKWPGIHEFQAVQNIFAKKDYLRSIIFARRVSFDSNPNRNAAAKLVDWVNKGYFTSGFNGVGYDPAWQGFAKGDGLLFITGTWLNPDLQKAMGRNVGFFLIPPRQGSSLVALGGAQLPFAITKKSRKPDIAARYLNFITSPYAMRLVLRNGGLPSVPVKGVKVAKGTAIADVLAAWDRVHKEDGMVEYLDHATPTMYNTISSAVQELTGMQISPDEFVRKVEADHEKFRRQSP